MLIKYILKRKFFHGQDRLFAYLFVRKKLDQGFLRVKPINGNFQLNVDTGTWIGAKVAFQGDYEPELKKVFAQNITPGDVILDIGANIGLHTLFFAEKTGSAGRVLAFEPVPSNFEELQKNVSLNHFTNISLHNVALGKFNETLSIDAEKNSKNPGAFNLFNQGSTQIQCRIGDDKINESSLKKVNFIKIDVEGYEFFVLEGLKATIAKYRPKIVFEYDSNYQKKSVNQLFKFFEDQSYQLSIIKRDGLTKLTHVNLPRSANILAIPV